MNTQDRATPLTAYGLAMRLGRTPVAVYLYLRRHGIEPSVVQDGRRYYAPATLEILREGMRARVSPKRLRARAQAEHRGQATSA